MMNFPIYSTTSALSFFMYAVEAGAETVKDGVDEAASGSIFSGSESVNLALLVTTTVVVTSVVTYVITRLFRTSTSRNGTVTGSDGAREPKQIKKEPKDIKLNPGGVAFIKDLLNNGLEGTGEHSMADNAIWKTFGGPAGRNPVCSPCVTRAFRALLFTTAHSASKSAYSNDEASKFLEKVMNVYAVHPPAGTIKINELIHDEEPTEEERKGWAILTQDGCKLMDHTFKLDDGSTLSVRSMKEAVSSTEFLHNLTSSNNY